MTSNSLKDTYHRNVNLPTFKEVHSQVHTAAIQTVKLDILCYEHNKQAAELKEWVKSQKASTKQKSGETITPSCEKVTTLFSYNTKIISFQWMHVKENKVNEWLPL